MTQTNLFQYFAIENWEWFWNIDTFGTGKVRMSHRTNLCRNVVHSILAWLPFQMATSRKSNACVCWNHVNFLFNPKYCRKSRKCREETIFSIYLWKNLTNPSKYVAGNIHWKPGCLFLNWSWILANCAVPRHAMVSSRCSESHSSIRKRRRKETVVPANSIANERRWKEDFIAVDFEVNISYLPIFTSQFELRPLITRCESNKKHKMLGLFLLQYFRYIFFICFYFFTFANILFSLYILSHKSTYWL